MKNTLLFGIVLSFGCVSFMSAKVILNNESDINAQVVVGLKDNFNIKIDMVGPTFNNVTLLGDTDYMLTSLIFTFDSKAPHIIKNMSYDMRTADVKITFREDAPCTIEVTNNTTKKTSTIEVNAEPYHQEAAKE